MKRAVATILTTGFLASPLLAAETESLQSQNDKVSYSIGLNVGKSLQRQEVDVNIDLVTQGIRDALGGGETLLSEEEVRQVLTEFQKELRSRQMARRNSEAKENQAEGDTFLAENKKKENVVTLPSGLQYQILEEGSGASPGAQDTVTVNYEGTLIDGTVFDSSYQRGQPATFQVNRVIKGWTEALQKMQVGDKWKLFIPSDLAYGKRGSGQKIGPNETLIFEVELLDVEKAEAKAQTKSNEPVTSDIIKVPSADELKKGAKIEVIKKEDLDKYKKEAEKAKKDQEKQKEN